MRFEFFLGLRYLRSKRKNFFISIITVISVAGVMVGVMALIVVLAVMTGFDLELREKILGNKAHLEITERGGLSDYDRLAASLEQRDNVVAAAPFVMGYCLLQNRRGASYPAIILGIEPDSYGRVTEFSKHVTSGGLESNGIVLGSSTAHSVRAFEGDEITVVTSRAFKHVLGQSYASKKLRVTGRFHSGYYDFDSRVAFLPMDLAQRLFGYKGSVTGLNVKLDDPFLAHDMAKELRDEFGSGYSVRTWIQQDQTFFNALRQEKLVMFIILAFIVLVAAFNIVSTLIMVVMEKTRDIGILRTVGASTRTIMAVFVFEGFIIGLIGTILGLVGGVIFANQLNNIADAVANITGFELFPSEMYIFDQIPVNIQPRDVLWTAGVAVVLSFLAAVYPAWQAARVDPVESLRYE